MDTLQAIFTRRSCRKFTNRLITPEELNTLVKAGMFAPTSHDCRSNHFVTVQDRETLDQLAALSPYWGMMRTAPLAIAVCNQPDEIDPENYPMLGHNAAAATENILLAATDIGLAGVWLAITPQMEHYEAAKKLFSLPENVNLICIAVIGERVKPAVEAERFDPAKWHGEKW